MDHSPPIVADEGSSLGVSPYREGSSSVSGRPQHLPPCPKRREMQRTDQDFHKLMNDFDSLLADAALGKLGGGGGGYVRANELPSSTGGPPRVLKPIAGDGSGIAPPMTSSQYDQFFKTAGTFSSVGSSGNLRAVATPQSRASSTTTTSSATPTSESRLGRLAPLLDDETSCNFSSNSTAVEVSSTNRPVVSGHRSLLGLLTAKLRKPTLYSSESRAATTQAKKPSPRPHSVPVDIAEFQRTANGGECLEVSTAEDGPSSTKHRPATTGDTPALARLPSTPRMESHWEENPSARESGSNKTAMEKEMEEIEKLRIKRDEDRRKREQEREERQLKRYLQQNPPPPRPPSPPPPPSIDDERKRLMDLIKQDMELLMEMEQTGREGKLVQEQQSFLKILREASYSREKIAISDEAQHQQRLRQIQERATVKAKQDDERERQRRWEIVRDTVVDEEQLREETVAIEGNTWDDLIASFFLFMDSPLIELQVEERLVRSEHVYELENEMFTFYERKALAEIESIQRRRLDRAWVSLTASHLSVPIMLYNKQCVVLTDEVKKRRHTYASREIEHQLLWERFCEDVQPLVDRELWKLNILEANLRMTVERDQRDESETVYHGCANSRELVSRYAAIVRETNARRLQQREEAISDVLEDELAERILLQRDEREAMILIEEKQRRDVDGMRMAAKKKHIEEAMKAAQGLRDAEIVQLELEEARQQKERLAAQQRKSAVGTPSTNQKKSPAPVATKVVGKRGSTPTK